MHSIGFVHRDIKSQNCRIFNDKVKIIGFEMAKDYKGKEQKNKNVLRNTN